MPLIINICHIHQDSCECSLGCGIYDWSNCQWNNFGANQKVSALVVFERVISGALKNGVIDEEEFNTLQTLHLETLNELTCVNRRMEAENRSLVEKSLMEEINELKKKAETKA